MSVIGRYTPIASGVHQRRLSKGHQDAAILAVGLGCGLRRSEITGLQISNIDLDRHLIQVLGKGNKLRYIGLNANVIFYLKNGLRPEVVVDVLIVSSKHAKGHTWNVPGH